MASAHDPCQRVYAAEQRLSRISEIPLQAISQERPCIRAIAGYLWAASMSVVGCIK